MINSIDQLDILPILSASFPASGLAAAHSNGSRFPLSVPFHRSGGPLRRRGDGRARTTWRMVLTKQSRGWTGAFRALGVSAVAAAAFASAPIARTAELDYGKPGEPVHLVVGYQPYYSEAWSGVVLNGLELWKKYLLAGSTVAFSIGLQGSIVVNAMLAGKQHIGYSATCRPSWPRPNAPSRTCASSPMSA